MTSTADLLRTCGLKVTPVRIRVLEALMTTSVPLSHSELEALLPEANRVTLYRVLDSLSACGLALKAVDARGVFRFSGAQSQREHKSHVHFHCTQCGAVFCLDAPPPLPPALPEGFRLDTVAYDIRGFCAHCQSLIL